MQADALAEPVDDEGLKRLTRVNWGIIQDDHAEIAGLRGLGGEGVQGGATVAEVTAPVAG